MAWPPTRCRRSAWSRARSSRRFATTRSTPFWWPGRPPARPSPRPPAYGLPGAVAIESPSTDKDAPVLVHPGAAAYLGDNQKSFFDRYGDQIFYGLLIFPVIGSGLRPVARRFPA